MPILKDTNYLIFIVSNFLGTAHHCEASFFVPMKNLSTTVDSFFYPHKTKSKAVENFLKNWDFSPTLSTEITSLHLKTTNKLSNRMIIPREIHRTQQVFHNFRIDFPSPSTKFYTVLWRNHQHPINAYTFSSFTFI